MHSKYIVATLFFSSLFAVSHSSTGLTSTFYDQTCPNAARIIRKIIKDIVNNSDARLTASLLRLHFHDCFVQGCDASVLLDNSSDFRTEKDAGPNHNSLRGFEVVDRLKAELEKECPGVVSCADILAIAANESVALSGGPSWLALLGRNDTRTANFSEANSKMPTPLDTLDQLRAKFEERGAHTIGKAQCFTFSARLYNFNNTGRADPTMDPNYRKQLNVSCPPPGNTTHLVNLDVTTPNQFDNAYFTNLQAHKGLLQTDQELFSTPGAADTVALVNAYSKSQSIFFKRFTESMIKMGNINVSRGTEGEIRKICTKVNGR